MKRSGTRVFLLDTDLYSFANNPPIFHSSAFLSGFSLIIELGLLSAGGGGGCANIDEVMTGMAMVTGERDEERETGG